MNKFEPCTECQADALTEEDGHIVCMECGCLCVESHSSLVHCDSSNMFNFVNTEVYTSSKKKHIGEPNGLHLGRVKTCEICDRLNFDSNMKESATRNFVRMYYTDIIKNSTTQTKMALAAVCAYIESRQNNYPVLMRDFKLFLQDDEYVRFNRCLTLAKKQLGVDFKNMSLAETVLSTMKKTTFPKQLYSQTINIIQLCDNLWIRRCHNRDTLIAPSAFLVWQGSPFCEDKHKSFPGFCRSYSFHPNTKGNNLLQTLTKKLYNMAKFIPWVDKKKIVKKHIPILLKDILSYQRTLMNKAFTDRDVVPSTPGKTDLEIEAELQEIDMKICEENPFLHHTEIHEEEFEDEMPDLIKSEEEIKCLKTFNMTS